MTVTFRDGDIPGCFKDFSVPIVIDGHTGAGIVDKNDTVLVSDGNRGGVIGGVTTITVQTSAFPAGSLKADKTISFDGNTYTIRQATEEGDAGLTKILIGSV